MEIDPPPDWRPPDVSVPTEGLPPESPVRDPLLVIGWREWVSLPGLGIKFVKAKVDTGARSSSLHAYDIDMFEEDGARRVAFKVHPAQRNEAWNVECVADVMDVRSVRSSSGNASQRVVIQTPLRWMGKTWPIELTLASRFEMGFRMLVGREAVRGRVLVDAGQSYFGPKPKRRKSGKRPPKNR